MWFGSRARASRVYEMVLMPGWSGKPSYFSLHGQRKVTKRKAAPKGATTPVVLPILGPTLRRRRILRRVAAARLLACGPFGAFTQNGKYNGRALRGV